MKRSTARKLNNIAFYTALILLTLALSFAGTSAVHVLQNPHHTSHGWFSCETE